MTNTKQQIPVTPRTKNNTNNKSKIRVKTKHPPKKHVNMFYILQKILQKFNIKNLNITKNM